MAEITAEMIKNLRSITGAGMMDCKKALEESKGDNEKAIEILRKRGAAIAAKRADRATEQGVVEAYIHHGNRIGTIVEVNCETDFVARTSEFKAFAHEIAMQITAMSPTVVRREDIPAAVIEREKDIYREQAKAEGKPEHIVEKIVESKLEKYYSEVVLLEQDFFKDNAKKIKDYVDEMVAKTGEPIHIRRFARYYLGEPIS